MLRGMAAPDRRLGQILVQMGAVTVPQVEEALEVQGRQGGAIGEILIRLGRISRDQLLRALSIQMGMSLGS